MMDLPVGCRCPNRGSHFVIEGTFTRESIVRFDAMCRPSALQVFERLPVPGESVASFSAMYPVPFATLSKRLPSSGDMSSAVENVLRDNLCVPSFRDPHENPEWIGELANSLPFKEVLRYKFGRPGHINVLEARMYKTFQKYCARHHPSTRTLALLDSKVTIGAVAKGRSSSPALSRVLQGALPYALGAGLYSGNLHVYSAMNRADGPSRNRPVDPPSRGILLWYEDLCRALSARS